MYCVIMGDIIHSKTLDFQERHADTIAIEKILNRINVKYIDQVLAQFGIVRGDAFEGILFSQQYAPQIIQDIIKSFYKERGLTVRISAVMDELSVVSADRNKADGPAFHKASYEIEEMKKIGSDHWFQICIQTKTIAQPLVASLMSLLAAITKEWTEKQRDIVWAMSDYSDDVSLVGKRLQIAKSVVKKQLKSAYFDAYRKAWADLEQYLIAAEDELGTPSKVNPSYTTFYSIGCRKNKLRDYESAMVNFHKAIALAEKEQNEKNDINLVPLYNGLAQAYIELYRIERDRGCDRIKLLDDARTKIDESLELQINHPRIPLDYARTLNARGNYCLVVGELELAIEYFEKAKAVIDENFDENHPMIAICDNNLAIAYKRQGNYEKALVYYRKSTDFAEMHRRDDPISYAESLNNIGLFYKEMGQLKEAEESLAESLEIFMEHLPIKHEFIAEVQADLEEIRRKIKSSK